MSLLIGPRSIAKLSAKLVLRFAFQGMAILQQPLVVVLLAVAVDIRVVFDSAPAYGLSRRLCEPYSDIGPSVLFGASNAVELAVVTAIGLFSSIATRCQPPLRACRLRRRWCWWWRARSTTAGGWYEAVALVGGGALGRSHP